MHIAEVVTIAKSLPLLRLNTYKSLILSYSADYRRIFSKKANFAQFEGNHCAFLFILTYNSEILCKFAAGLVNCYFITTK